MSADPRQGGAKTSAAPVAANEIVHTPMMARPEREFPRGFAIARVKTSAKTYALTADVRRLM